MNQNRQVFIDSEYMSSRLARNPDAFSFKNGLNNMGNTCFMNSILNCLFGDPELCQLVLNPRHFEAYSQDTRLRLLKHFANLVRAASAGSQPELIKTAVENFEKMVRLDTQSSNLFPKGQQADAHEFLVYLVERLKEQFDLLLPTLYPQQLRFPTIFDEFQVGLSQTTFCERNHRSQKTSRAWMTLDIGNNRNIQQCLDEYFRPVNMNKCTCSPSGLAHNDRSLTCNPYRCDQCGRHVGATQSLSINYLPTILPLHLKRFEFDQKSRQVNTSFFCNLSIYIYHFDNSYSLSM